LVERGGLSNDLAELGDDSVGGVVVGSSKDALVDGSGEVLDGGLDELAWEELLVVNVKVVRELTHVGVDVKERNLGLIPIGREGPTITTVFILADRSEEVGSKEARKNKSSRNIDLSDVLLNLSLALKMLDVSKTTVANLVGIKKGREDELFDARSLASVGDGLALSDLAVAAVGLPVVCDEEDSVSVLDSWSDLLSGVHVGL
jgi:hypothetical protein